MYYIIELGGQYPAVRRQGRAPLDGCILQEISRLCAFQGRNEVMETVILEKTIIKWHPQQIEEWPPCPCLMWPRAEDIEVDKRFLGFLKSHNYSVCCRHYALCQKNHYHPTLWHVGEARFLWVNVTRSDSRALFIAVRRYNLNCSKDSVCPGSRQRAKDLSRS